MSLDVAIQSVVFYVLSCSTCSKISHRRKAKVQAKRERAEKQALETEQPGLYRHPSPFSTNPYWTEEIMMGPGPPQKKDKGANKNTSQRALNTAGQGSSYAGSTGMSTDAPSSPTAVDGSRLSGDDWNRKRYQREDEALWGIDFQGSSQKIKHVIAKAGESAGRLLSKSPLKEEEPYYMSRNPPVNDLHPPVVSSHTSREETRWMLQPPPSAKVMEGKVRVNRSRADSDGSTIKNSLSRQMTERTLDSKMQRGETPSRTGSKTPRSSRQRLQRYESNRSTSPEQSEDSSIMNRKRKPPPLSISTPTRNSSMDTLEQVLPTLPEPVKGSEMRERSPRPHLKTIVSSSNLVPKVTCGDLPPRELSSNSTNSDVTTREQPPAKTPLSTTTIPNSSPKAPEMTKSRIDNLSAENAPTPEQLS